MPFKIVRNDITKMQVDAIVNTANQSPICSTGLEASGKIYYSCSKSVIHRWKLW